MLAPAVFGIHNNGLNLAVDLVILFLVVIWLALIFWTWADARRRIADPMLVGCGAVPATGQRRPRRRRENPVESTVSGARRPERPAEATVSGGRRAESPAETTVAGGRRESASENTFVSAPNRGERAAPASAATGF